MYYSYRLYTKKVNPCAYIMLNIFLSWFPGVDSILEDFAIHLLLCKLFDAHTNYMYGRVRDRKLIKKCFFLRV